MMTDTLERQYGRGLKNLFPEGKFSMSKFNEGKRRLTETIFVGGVVLKIDDWRTGALGVATALQWNNDFQGKCFYAILGTINSADYLVTDYERLLSDGQFYNLVVYDPIHISANANAAYEMCMLDQIYDQIISLGSLNYAYMGELAVRQVWTFAADTETL